MVQSASACEFHSEVVEAKERLSGRGRLAVIFRARRLRASAEIPPIKRPKPISLGRLVFR